MEEVRGYRAQWVPEGEYRRQYRGRKSEAMGLKWSSGVGWATVARVEFRGYRPEGALDRADVRGYRLQEPPRGSIGDSH